MNNYEAAQVVLKRGIDELIREIAQCGSAGGTGKSQSYAPVLNSLFLANEHIEILKQATLLEESEAKRGPGRPKNS